MSGKEDVITPGPPPLALDWLAPVSSTVSLPGQSFHWFQERYVFLHPIETEIWSGSPWPLPFGDLASGEAVLQDVLPTLESRQSHQGMFGYT